MNDFGMKRKRATWFAERRSDLETRHSYSAARDGQARLGLGSRRFVILRLSCHYGKGTMLGSFHLSQHFSLSGYW